MRILALAGVVAAVILAATQSATADRAQYPLTLQNCGATITFERAPERAVSIGQSSTEILLSLGLAEKIVGTAVWLGPVLEQYGAANSRIRRISDDRPSFESVVAEEPQIVVAQFEGYVGPHGAVATREQFSDLGIATYVSPADCAAKDNTGGGDGVRGEMYDFGLLYQEIRELAEIFDVAERGEALVSELERREAEASAALADSGIGDVSVVFWFSSPRLDGEAYVAGKNGAPAYMLSVLGATNIITTEEEWPLVGWETIAGADPDIIVIADMERRRYGADDAAEKLKFLRSDPLVSRLAAVRENRLIIMDAQSMNPTIRTIDGIEALARGIVEFGLAK